MSQTFEEWHAFIAAQLGEPLEPEQRSDGATYFTAGRPGEVIVRLSKSSITVWEYAVTLDREAGPTVTPRLVGVVRWRRLGERPATKAVAALIDGARESRRARFRVCEHCGDRLPPEWMNDEGVCIACAQHRSNAVH